MSPELLSEYRKWFKKSYPDYEFTTWDELGQFWLAVDDGAEYYSMPFSPKDLCRTTALPKLKAGTKLLVEKAESYI